MNVLTQIHVDSMQTPERLDYTDRSWSYPIKSQDMTMIPAGAGPSITGCYRSKLIPVRDVLDTYATPFLDLVVYCHGMHGSQQGGVRVFCWKNDYDVTTETAPSGTVQMVLVNNVGLVDVTAQTLSGNASGIWVLRVADTFDNLQLLIGADCSGVSAYLRDPTAYYAGNKQQFIRTFGVKQ